MTAQKRLVAKTIKVVAAKAARFGKIGVSTHVGTGIVAVKDLKNGGNVETFVGY